MAQGFAAQGARWLHLVDLDAARVGGYGLLPLLRQLCAQTPLRIQTGGGVRDEAAIAILLEAGASRVVLGTPAVRDPGRVVSWARRFGAERLVLALDARLEEDGAWTVRANGWTQSGGEPLDVLLGYYAAHGLVHVLCTDIERDGMLGGFNLGLYREMAARWPQFRWQASGGVRDVADVRAAREAGARVAILGRALLEQRLSLAEALAC